MNRSADRLARLRFRATKAAKALLEDITPPFIWKLLVPKQVRKGLPASFIRTAAGKPFVPTDENIAELNYLRGIPLLEIPISRMRYAGGIPFDRETHHFVRYLQLGTDALEKFYSSHQPRDIFERHFLKSPPKSGRDIPLRGFPWLTYGEDRFDRNVAVEKGLGAEHGHQHFGPVSQQKIALEAGHLDRLCRSFEKKGFEDHGEYPSGYFLVDTDGSWAFYIKDGQHRISVMAHLGYEKALVTTWSNYCKVVKAEQAGDWPMVRNGMLREAEAVAILRTYTRSAYHTGVFQDSATSPSPTSGPA
jgi:hypothetical protein